MQKACEMNPSTMAAVLGLADEKVEAICNEVQSETGEVVVPANYNCPGQLVISGSLKGIDIACERMKAAGAKRALGIAGRRCFSLTDNGVCQRRTESCLLKLPIFICLPVQSIKM
jgi:hypothetical protein